MNSRLHASSYLVDLLDYLHTTFLNFATLPVSRHGFMVSFSPFNNRFNLNNEKDLISEDLNTTRENSHMKRLGMLEARRWASPTFSYGSHPPGNTSHARKS